MTNCRMRLLRSERDEHNNVRWWYEPCIEKAVRGGCCEKHMKRTRAEWLARWAKAGEGKEEGR